jgi:glycosyltransferase involved in cell wall biosynthesis
MPKKIGYVVKRYPRYSETFIVNEILAHEDAGLEVQIFSLNHPDDSHFQDIVGEVQSPVTYITQDTMKASSWWDYVNKTSEVIPGLFQMLEVFRNERFRHVYQAIELAKIIKTTGIDHLHAHFATSATTVARMASYFANIPYTFTAHAKDIYHEDIDFKDLQSKIHDASSVITVSNYNIEHLTRTFSSDKDKIKRIYNGLDLSKLEYRIPKNRKPHIITIGRLVEKKGLNILVDACDILAKRGVDFHCSIIGKGELKSELLRQIKEKNLQDKVELTGALPRTQSIQKFYDASIFAAPAIVADDGNRDGLPTSILESMALGVPCISTDVTGIPEVLKNNETGIIVPQNNSVELANAIEKLLNDSELSILMSKNARKLIESDFDISKNSAKIREIFSKPVISQEIVVKSDE